ncbi:hypothetical protein OROGR_013619 [Orobanche gracilis]
MEPKRYLLDEITPDTKNWTAKVSIVNKTEPRTSSQPSSIRFQKLLLADNKGNRVEGMVYRGDIELLKNSLRPHQTYLISNAVVRPVKPGFENPLTNNKYQWILGARTAILATDEDALTSSELAPTFTQSDHFRDFLGTAAIIIDEHAPRTVTAKGKQNTLHEYAAVDEQLRPFIITLWNDAAPDDVYNLLNSTQERQIIAALNFTVTDYHNISLSSTSASVILINSNIERVQTLQKWEVWSDLLVRGKLARTNQNFIYPCCAKCHRLTTAAYGNLFECHSCNEIRSAIPRFRFSLLVYDKSGEIEVTVFGDEGEKIMQMSAPDFLNKYCNDDSLIFESINSMLHQMQLKTKIQSKFFYRQDGTTTLSHTMQTLECLQLTSPGFSGYPTQMPEISTSSTPETASVQSTTKATCALGGVRGRVDIENGGDVDIDGDNENLENAWTGVIRLRNEFESEVYSSDNIQSNIRDVDPGGFPLFVCFDQFINGRN